MLRKMTAQEVVSFECKRVVAGYRLGFRKLVSGWVILLVVGPCDRRHLANQNHNGFDYGYLSCLYSKCLGHAPIRG
jgi:hypothetical protein